MIVSDDTERRYVQHRDRTHNAGVAGSSPAPAMELDDLRESGGSRNGSNGSRFSVTPEVALCLALSSQEPRQSSFTWHLIRVNDKTGETKVVATRTAPSRVEAERLFREQWGANWPSDWTIVAEVALATFRPISRNRVKWQRGQNR